MKKSGTFGHTHIHTDLSCEKSGKLCNLNGMPQSILTITGTEFHTSKKFQKFRMDSMNTHIHGCCLTVFTDLCFHFFLGFLHHLFNSCRMNTSIHNKFLQSHSGDLSTDRIKRGENNCLRCIINDQIHTGKCLQCTDVTALTTDNPSLHFITWKLYHRNCCLRYVIYRTFLDGIDHIFLSFLVGFFLGSVFKLFIESCNIHLYVIFYRFQ